MDKIRRNKVIDEQAVTSGAAISTTQCGLVSLILVGAVGVASSVTLYDHATATTGNKKKVLTTSNGTSAPTTIVYCPSKPDAFSNGIFAVVTGTGAMAYLSIEPV